MIAGQNASAEVLFAVVPLLFIMVFIGFMALIISLVVKASRRERARREQLWAYASQCGWRPPAPGSPVPPVVQKAARSRRTKLALVTNHHGLDVWLVWHQWTESHSSGDSTTTTTHNLTRYFLWPPTTRPDVRLSRRTQLGAALKSVRGAGTGDAEFDRRFMLHGDVPVYLPDGLRYGMLMGELPIWEIAGGTLVTPYPDLPTVQNLQYRADAIVRLVQALG